MKNSKSASDSMIPSAVRSLALKESSTSRRGTPVQAQTMFRTVIFCVISGSPTAKVGRISTTRVSQSISPSSTSVAIIMVVIDLVVDPIIINVSVVTGSSLPSSRTPKPLAYTNSPPLTMATARPGVSRSSMVSEM